MLSSRFRTKKRKMKIGQEEKVMKVFAKKLKETMEELKLTQKQLAAMTGCSRAAVSQYICGVNTPPIEKQTEMAEALGLPRDFFQREDPVQKIKTRAKGKIPQLAVTDAAKLLGVSIPTIRFGLQQGVFPWGYGIRCTGSWVYFINAKRFAEIEKIDVDWTE